MRVLREFNEAVKIYFARNASIDLNRVQYGKKHIHRNGILKHSCINGSARLILAIYTLMGGGAALVQW